MFNFKIILGNKYHKTKKDKNDSEKCTNPKHKHTDLEQDGCCVINEEDKHSKK